MQIEAHIKFIRHKMRKVMLFFIAIAISSIATIWMYGSIPINSLALLPQSSLDVSDLENSAKWYKVNQIPYSISPLVDRLCVAPAIGTRQKPSPHEDRAIIVYVNQIGTKAMMSAKSMLFPTGAVIVKKKVDRRSGEGAALLYTVMIKNEIAFNPKAGGWEFAVVSGNPPQIQSRGDLASCMECHLQRKQDDYVFRTYR